MKNAANKVKTYLKTLGGFIGPGFMIAVGYLDPGNWATDMEGGSSFGYRLLFIILVSNVIAIFLQNLTIRLGTVTGLDLASASRKYFPRWLNWILYLLAECAIVATDIAEVIGSAIALNLLFPSLPLPAGVAITAVDVLIILLFYNEEPEDDNQSTSTKMVRFFEMFVMLLVAAVGICFIIELAYSDIVAVDVLKGYIPTKEIFTQSEILYVAIGIVGATVMPHNLYLHSFIVQARCREWRTQRPKVYKYNDSWLIQKESGHIEKLETKEIIDTHVSLNLDDEIESCRSQIGIDFDKLRTYLNASMNRNLHYGFVDLFVALLFAFFVNSAILVVASANFYYGPEGQQQQVQDLFGAHDLLLKYLGPPAAVTFALALLCAGQSSTLTATLAGQVVMSGFLGMTTRPWIRRIVTRLIAIIPALVAACIAGREGLSNMLVGSQVALSIQLPFAVVPLVYFTTVNKVMKLELVVETKTLELEPIQLIDQNKMSLVDRVIARLRFSKSISDWIQFPQFNKINKASIKNYIFQPSTSNSPVDEAINKTVNDIEDRYNKLESWPTPIIYSNGKIMCIISVLVALLLIGLNGYLVVSLFLNI